MSSTNYPQKGGRIEVTTVFDRFLDSNIMKSEWTKKDIVSFRNSTQRIAMTPMDTVIYEALSPGQPFDSVAVADKMNMFYGDWATLFGRTERMSGTDITDKLATMGLERNPRRVPFEHLNPVDVKNYMERIANVYRAYIPLREMNHSGYAKLSALGMGKHSGTGRDIPFEKSLSSVIDVFGTVAGPGTGLLSEFYDFIKTHSASGINLSDDYARTTTEIVAEMDKMATAFPDDGDSDSDMRATEIKSLMARDKVDSVSGLFIMFAWEKSGLLTETETESEQPPPLTGGSGGGFDGLDGSDSRTTVFGPQNYRRMVVFTCLMSFMYNIALLVGSVMYLASFVTRIMDLRQQYVTDGDIIPGQDPTDPDAGNWVHGVMNVVWEFSVVGGVELLLNIQSLGNAYAHTVFENSIADAALINEHSYGRGVAMYINDWMSGRNSVDWLNLAHLNGEHAQYEIRLQLQKNMLEMKTDLASLTSGLTQSINGISYTTIVMLSVLYPDTVTSENVVASTAAAGAAATTSGYLNIANIANVANIVSTIRGSDAGPADLNLVGLFGTTIYNLAFPILPSTFRSAEDRIRAIEPGSESEADADGLMIENGEFTPDIDVDVDADAAAAAAVAVTALLSLAPTGWDRARNDVNVPDQTPSGFGMAGITNLLYSSEWLSATTMSVEKESTAAPDDMAIDESSAVDGLTSIRDDTDERDIFGGGGNNKKSYKAGRSVKRGGRATRRRRNSR